MKVRAAAPLYGQSIRSFLDWHGTATDDNTPSGGSITTLHRDQLKRNVSRNNNDSVIALRDLWRPRANDHQSGYLPLNKKEIIYSTNALSTAELLVREMTQRYCWKKRARQHVILAS